MEGKKYNFVGNFLYFNVIVDNLSHNLRIFYAIKLIFVKIIRFFFPP